MGVVNVTPDSFSDGGLFLDAPAAVAHGRELAAQGAEILDIGGESTRPGAEPVGEAEELRRVLPVIEGLVGVLGAPRDGSRADGARQAQVDDVDGKEPQTQLSVDTTKAAVARAALAAGASLVNDVSALRADPEMAGVVAECGAQCCLMHMQGEPRTMQRAPRYEDVVDDVKAFLEERMGFAVRAGIAEKRLLLDPGIGFGKTLAHNLELLRRLKELTTLGRPLVVGTSRKSFLGRLIADAEGREAPVDTAERLPGTLATSVLAYERGATVLRVHDVVPMRAALVVAAATLGEPWARMGMTARI
jgi:dihydropteroate synthase